MLRNNRGYILIDAILAVSLILTMCLFTIPMVKKVRIEQHILDVRSHMLSEFYNEFILSLNNFSHVEKQIILGNTIGKIEIIPSETGINGCIRWVNLKSKEESKCFYVSKKVE